MYIPYTSTYVSVYITSNLNLNIIPTHLHSTKIHTSDLMGHLMFFIRLGPIAQTGYNNPFGI